MVPKEMVFIISLILLILFNFKFVEAHIEHAGPDLEETSFWYKIFQVHDYIHPIFFILLIYSCYYFRIFSSKNIDHEPKTCMGQCSKCYKSEGKLKQYHRHFFWITLFLAFVHTGEILSSIKNFSMLYGLDRWILVSETTYLGFAFLYLGTCYHFRYFVERMANKRILGYKFYNRLTSLNRHHDLFFWLTIISVLIRFILVAIETGSLLKAIPGTF